MRPLDILGFSFGAVRGRKLRFVLTLLGVMIGVAAIVALLSLSQGLQVSVTDQLRSGLATDTLIVAPMDPESGALRISDDDRMKDIDGVTMVAPVIQGIGVMEAGDATLEVEVVGVDLQKYRSIYGAMFTSEEGEIPRGSADGEMVIGSAVKDPEQDGSSIARPGDTVALMGSDLAGPMATDRSEFRIAATLREVGGMNIGGLSDSAVYISLDDAVDLFGTSDCTFIIVQMEDDDEATIDAVTAAIKDAFDDQVRISSSRGVQDLVDRVFSTLDLFLISVASISLMVAGAGIMNTMMISLIERRKEIGLLKALGMRDRTVLTIFLGEAAIIGITGGLLGAALGTVAARLVAQVWGNIDLPDELGTWANVGIAIQPVIEPPVLMGAVVFGLMISMIFAIYPAWRSSRLLPVEALRNE